MSRGRDWGWGKGEVGCLKSGSAAAEPRKGICGQKSYQECVLVGVGAEGWADGAEPEGSICILAPRGFWGVTFKK